MNAIIFTAFGEVFTKYICWTIYVNGVAVDILIVPANATVVPFTVILDVVGEI